MPRWGSEHRLHLELARALYGATRRSVPESEMPGGITADAERLRLHPLVLSAIGDRVQHQHLRLRWDIDIGDFSRKQQLFG